jgi:pre-mRNA-splicing factor ATP-dependent RNA helicase DHX38/PRP16
MGERSRNRRLSRSREGLHGRKCVSPTGQDISVPTGRSTSFTNRSTRSIDSEQHLRDPRRQEGDISLNSTEYIGCTHHSRSKDSIRHPHQPISRMPINLGLGCSSGHRSASIEQHDGQSERKRSLEKDANMAQRFKPALRAIGSSMFESARSDSRDGDAWELNRVQNSGVDLNGSASNFSKRKFDPLCDADHFRTTESLVVHHKTPNFLASKHGLMDTMQTSLLENFQSQGMTKQPVRDPHSDMVLAANRGSALVSRLRESRENTRQIQSLIGSDVKPKNSNGIINPSPSTSLSSNYTHSVDPDLVNKPSISITRGRQGADRIHAVESPNESVAISIQKMSPNHDSIDKERMRLPAYKCRQDLLNIICDNRVVILVGETGSGKTTQLAQYLLEDGLGGPNRGVIGCTQPRRVAAMSVARRVAEEVGCQLGTTVGYSIRFDDCTSPGKTYIKYMTDGVLLRESLQDPDLDAYSVIIVDEAHERSLQTDVLLGLLRRILCKRRDLRVIITSATLDASRFIEYFDGAPLFTIPGRAFPVEVFYSDSPVNDYVDSAIKKALEIHANSPPGDILIFMTGQEDIEAVCNEIRVRMNIFNASCESNERKYAPLNTIPVYSQMPVEQQGRIFQPSQDGERKCIVATNIAETSLTVDGVKYVVDCGFSKIKVYSSRMGMDALQVYPISQAAANQRAGRAGRTAPGICYRLYTEAAYRTELLETSVPEIQRTNLANMVLLLRSIGVIDLLRFGFLDSPPKDALLSAITQLWMIGALSGSEGLLTDIGRRMIQFPLDPPLSKMLLLAERHGCTEEILTIVSMISAPTIFHRPKERSEESDLARERFTIPESDHLTLLVVFNEWRRNGSSDRWCEANFLNNRSLRRASDIRKQLEELLKKQSIKIVSAGDSWDPIRMCIAAASVHRAAKLKRPGEYFNMIGGTVCHLHPTSALFGSANSPEYVVYHELILTSKEYLNCVTAVEPRWLAEASPDIYSLRITDFGPDGRSTFRILNYTQPAPNASLVDSSARLCSSKDGLNPSNTTSSIPSKDDAEPNSDSFRVVIPKRLQRPKDH